MNGKTLLVAAAVAACLVVAGLLVRAVGAPEPLRPDTGHAPAAVATVATEATSATSISSASGVSGPAEALRHALVSGGCGGAPVWLAFDYPAAWWLSDDASGMLVQNLDPSVVSYNPDFAKAVVSICPKGKQPGPPTQPHTALPIQFAGLPSQLYSIDGADTPMIGGLMLRADVTVDGSPVFFEGFVSDSDHAANRAAYRAALDALLASVHRVSAPVPGPDWQAAQVQFGTAADGAQTLTVDADLPPGWALTAGDDGRSAVVAPVQGSPATGASSGGATGAGVHLERLDDPAAAGWNTGHPWLSVRLLDATTVYLPGRDGAPDAWLAGGPTLAIRISAAATGSSSASPDASLNALADPVALHILRNAKLRLTDGQGAPVPWPSFGLGYPSP